MISFFSEISSFPSVSPQLATDLFLQIHGQSNARANINDTTPDSIYTGDINGAEIFNVTQWEALNYPNNNDTNTSGSDFFGIECPLALKYINQYNKNVYIGKKAIGSTGIGEEISNQDWNVNSDEYINLIDDATNALLNKKNELGVDGIHIFYSHWGERDANLNNVNFISDFLAIVNRIEQIYPLDLIIAPILNSDVYLTSPLTQQEVEDQRARQIQLANENSKIFNIDMNQFELGPDGIHYTADVHVEIANQMLAIINNALY